MYSYMCERPESVGHCLATTSYENGLCRTGAESKRDRPRTGEERAGAGCSGVQVACTVFKSFCRRPWAVVTWSCSNVERDGQDPRTLDDGRLVHDGGDVRG